MDKSTHTLLDIGSWSNDVSWELYATSVLPPADLCSAVMCVAIRDNKVILARSERGWGMLGGHIEGDETFEETLYREALEEGGFIIDSHTLFAVRKIISRRPIPHQQEGRTYPYPVSYIPYYVAVTDKELLKPTGEEILENGSFILNDLPALKTRDQRTIEAGWRTLQGSPEPKYT